MGLYDDLVLATLCGGGAGSTVVVQLLRAWHIYWDLVSWFK